MELVAKNKIRCLLGGATVAAAPTEKCLNFAVALKQCCRSVVIIRE